MLNEITGIILIIVGLLITIGVIILKRRYAVVFGIPTGIFLIILGGAFAGWIDTPWF